MNRKGASPWVLAVGLGCMALLILLIAQVAVTAKFAETHITGRVTVEGEEGTPIGGVSVRAADPETREGRGDTTTDDGG